MPDLYDTLAIPATDTPADIEDDRPQPTTRVTLSVETVDNDHAGVLIGSITI